ncbi:hypothetical protein Y032_0118g773 [Ancylostoma ceylanicum]|uniref:EGF-like domain-containing protein n=2 Tax=Ancylostoma ceylanicum TaxID=53326 RepID=A0A016TAZ5_9BILA|nr:hypothetical protein Y032_0118g773 [Ancylostoma ceylanicum]
MQVEMSCADGRPNANCGIGGFLMPNGECVCHRFWTGENCDKTICINGGYSLDDKMCICPTGYLGPHCEAVTTSQPPVLTFAKHSTFNLIIYNIFTDYWGRNGFEKFKESIGKHLEQLDYNQYNAAVFTEADANADALFEKYKSQKSTSAKEEFLAYMDEQAPVYPKKYGCIHQPFYEPMYNYITSLNLRETAVTIITQFPPQKDNFHRDKLQELALAFNIRINVIWISDETFVRCLHNNDKNEQYDELSHLASITGGMFVPQKYGHNDNASFTDVVIGSHYQYQPVSFGAFKDCSQGKSISWQADSQPVENYLVVEGAEPEIKGCSMEELPGSLSTGPRMFLVKAQKEACHLTLTNKGGECSAKAFFSDTNETGIRLYPTFVEDPIIDSSRYRPTEGNNFYMAMRVEVNNQDVTVKPVTNTIYFDGAQSFQIEMDTRKDPVTFTFVTKEPFKCKSADSAWWWAVVWIEVKQKDGAEDAQKQYTIDRVIPFKCRRGPASSTIPSSATTTTGADTSSTGGTASENIAKLATAMAPVAEPKNFPIDNPSTFVYGFANSVPKDIYETFMDVSLNNINSSFGNFGVVRFEVADNAVGYHPEEKFEQLESDLRGDYGYEKVPSSPPNAESQILAALTAVTKSEKVYENSLISFCVDKLPRANQYAGTLPYSSLVNKNIKTLFLLDAKTLDREVGYRRTASPLNEIAAATNGHLIVSDEANKDAFKQLLQKLYTHGPSQSLLFARSVKPSEKATALGQLEIKRELQVTITVTTSVYNSTDLKSQEISIILTGSTDTVETKLAHTDGSNFFSSTVELHPQSFDVSLKTSNTDKEIHIRMWFPRTNERLKVGYADLKNELLPTGPDTVNGAAARVTIFGSVLPANLLVEIRDCASKELKLFDGKQEAVMTSSGDAFFVPVFCTTESHPGTSCVASTQNKYDVQFTSSNGLSEMRSFICQRSQTDNSADCQQKDSNGNFECIGDQAPFYRGPTGAILDCSSHGHLYYDITKNRYLCECDARYTGESCEIGICHETKTPPDEADARYRTYTVVVGVDKDNYGSEEYLLGNVSNVALPEKEPSTVWRYQLILYCDNGKVLPVYAGGSFKDFANAVKSKPRQIFCDNSKKDEDGAFDINTVYRAAVNGLGRVVRGMIVFYNELPTQMKVNLEEFIVMSRVYRQELFIYALDTTNTLPYADFSDVRNATFITGGNILYGTKDGDGNVRKLDAFSEMLSSTTSLLVHANCHVGQFAITVDAGAEAYAFVSKANTTIVRVADATGLPVDQIHVGSLSSVYQLKGNTEYSFKSNVRAYYAISVVILNGLTPTFTVVGEGTDTANTALISPNTPVGPSIALTLPDGWQVKNNADKNYRVATRKSCTFGHSTYTMFPSMKYGMNFVTVALKNGTTELSRVMPFASAAQIDCQNNGKEDGNKCSCPDGFSTPDCSRPMCEQGILNTWGDVCNCDWSSGGRHCQPAQAKR